jgi:mercuric reductase
MGSREYRFIVRGMTCGHCADTVKKAIVSVAGVERAEVDFESGRAVVIGETELDPQQVVSAINQAGYPTEMEKAGPEYSAHAPQSAPAHVSRSNRADADLIIVGGGSAGFAAAIRGHELGAKVILVNAGGIGGTCVNVGCVPSKTLIRAAEAVHRASHIRFAGIESSSRVSDFSAIIRQKDELVGSLRQAKYIDVLAAYENIRLVEGRARFVSRDAITVDGRTIRAPRIVVTTGSRPWIPPIPGLREVELLTSTTAFELGRLPESVVVLGGRYIALECAQMLARLGAKVTILQRSDHLLPDEDEDLTDALAGYLREDGIAVETSVRIESVSHDPGQVTVQARVDGAERSFHAERILCATGRRPITEGMGLETVGIGTGEDGRIVVDDHLQTSVAGVFAAGDVIGEPAFVYTAAYEGRLAAENALNGVTRKRDYTALPWVIFTDPQIAGVGMNEKEALRAGVEIDTAKLDLSNVPRALAARDTRGFIKLIKQRDGDKLLGARVLAQEGGEQIMEAAMAIRFGLGVSEIAAMFHPYLTQAEGIKLCAQAFSKDVKKLSCCSA